MTTASATRSAPVTAIHRLEVPGGGWVDVTVRERGRMQPFPGAPRGAGPASVASFCDLLAARRHARVIMPIHPGVRRHPPASHPGRHGHPGPGVRRPA